MAPAPRSVLRTAEPRLGASLRLTVALIVAGAALTGCSSGTAPAAARLPPPPSNTVQIRSGSFSPQSITVPTGTVVTWTNAAPTRHSVRGLDGAFDSRELNTGQSYSYTFGRAGTYRYGCALHPEMTGTVTVG